MVGLAAEFDFDELGGGVIWAGAVDAAGGVHWWGLMGGMLVEIVFLNFFCFLEFFF